jgi:hypothetical protein
MLKTVLIILPIRVEGENAPRGPLMPLISSVVAPVPAGAVAAAEPAPPEGVVAPVLGVGEVVGDLAGVGEGVGVAAKTICALIKESKQNERKIIKMILRSFFIGN